MEGFYFNYPVVNNKETQSEIISNVAHCLLTYKPGMMGLVNDPVGCTIDMTTLEFVKYVEVPCNASLLH